MVKNSSFLPWKCDRVFSLTSSLIWSTQCGVPYIQIWSTQCGVPYIQIWSTQCGVPYIQILNTLLMLTTKSYQRNSVTDGHTATGTFCSIEEYSENRDAKLIQSQGLTAGASFGLLHTKAGRKVSRYPEYHETGRVALM
jgi:hypothetical protein